MANKRPKLYLQGKPLDHFEEVHEHVSPISSYVKVLGALFVLTALTYLVSFADLGPASLAVAMLVALVKASLVCAYFMHLRYDNKYHVFIFVSTLLFVAIFFTFTLFDLEQRDRLIQEQDTFFRRGSDGDWSDTKRLKKPRPAPGSAGEATADGKAEEGKADAKADGKAPAKADGKAPPKRPPAIKKSAPIKVDLSKGGGKAPPKAAGDAKAGG